MKITFSRKNGVHLGVDKLGNQMFKLAGLRTASKLSGHKAVLPSRDSLAFIHGPVTIYDYFDLEETFDIEDIDIEHEVEMPDSPNEELMKALKPNTAISGYCVDADYVIPSHEQVLKDFKIKDMYLDIAKEYVHKNIGEPFLTIHVRRGDYFRPKQNYLRGGILTPKNYYEKALAEFDKDIKVLIVSDEPEWCKNHYAFQGSRFTVSENAIEVDFALMTLAEQHILGSSTFGWWAAYLAETKKGYCNQSVFYTKGIITTVNYKFKNMKTIYTHENIHPKN